MDENDYKRVSRSQVAEDLIAAYLLSKDKGVTYIDVGCLWPIKLSNTYFFYERGGSGLCIDPNPEAQTKHALVRPRDMFVLCGVGSTEEDLTYHRFENPVFNTFDPKRAEKLVRQNRPGRHLLGTDTIPIRRLADILVETGFLERYGQPDLLSVDVEGLELEVLRGTDFGAIRPTIIICETVVNRNTGTDHAVSACLYENGYELAAHIGHDAFFRRKV